MGSDEIYRKKHRQKRALERVEYVDKLCNTCGCDIKVKAKNRFLIDTFHGPNAYESHCSPCMQVKLQAIYICNVCGDVMQLSDHGGMLARYCLTCMSWDEDFFEADISYKDGKLDLGDKPRRMKVVGKQLIKIVNELTDKETQ